MSLSGFVLVGALALAACGDESTPPITGPGPTAQQTAPTPPPAAPPAPTPPPNPAPPVPGPNPGPTPGPGPNPPTPPPSLPHPGPVSSPLSKTLCMHEREGVYCNVLELNRESHAKIELFNQNDIDKQACFDVLLRFWPQVFETQVRDKELSQCRIIPARGTMEVRVEVPECWAQLDVVVGPIVEKAPHPVERLIGYEESVGKTTEFCGEGAPKPTPPQPPIPPVPPTPPPTIPPVPPVPPTPPVCPTNARLQVTNHSIVEKGNTAYANFTITGPEGCKDMKILLSLVSYERINPLTKFPQGLIDAKSKEYGPGTYTEQLSVIKVTCVYEVALRIGNNNPALLTAENEAISRITGPPCPQ